MVQVWVALPLASHGIVSTIRVGTRWRDAPRHGSGCLIPGWVTRVRGRGASGICVTTQKRRHELHGFWIK